MKKPIAFEFPRRIERDYPITKQGKPSRIFRKNKTVSDFEALLLEVNDIPEQMSSSESCEFVPALEYDL